MASHDQSRYSDTELEAHLVRVCDVNDPSVPSLLRATSNPPGRAIFKPWRGATPFFCTHNRGMRYRMTFD